MTLSRKRIAALVGGIVLVAGGALLAMFAHAKLQAGTLPEPMTQSFPGDIGEVEEPVGPEDALGEFGLPTDVELRRRAVLGELATLRNHEWAGEYFYSEGEATNVRLVLAPGAGAAIWWNGCLGLYGAEQGPVEMGADGVLQLDLPPQSVEEFARFPTRLLPVRWGERRYLVEPTKLVEFVNEVNSGFEPRSHSWGSTFLKVGDEEKPVAGLPELPQRQLTLIRNESLVVHVLAVERLPDDPPMLAGIDEAWCERRYRLTLDRGVSDGLVAGVELR
jgi:hypothetical protein